MNASTRMSEKKRKNVVTQATFVAPEVKVKGEPHGPEKFSELFPLTKRKRKSVAKKVSPATDARRGGDPLTVSEDWPTRQRRACALFLNTRTGRKDGDDEAGAGSDEECSLPWITPTRWSGRVG